jgi:hypothetical protein
VKEIRKGREEYLDMLRQVHPLDHQDPHRRFVHEIGSQAARRLNGDPEFHDALKNGQMAKAGRLFHRSAKEVADQLTAAAREAGLNVKAERKVGRSIPDLVINTRGKGPITEFDYKAHIKTALHSIRQMEKHSKDLGPRLKVQESRNWFDFVRAEAPDAAKLLPKKIVPVKPYPR